MICGKEVHYEMSPGTAVVHIAQHVQAVNRQALYHVGYGYNEIVGTPCRDYRADYHFYIGGLVHVVRPFVEQFLDYVRKVLGQRLADF